ncbi:MAG: MFS transporter [Actinomycetes bacterium]
MSWYAGVHPYGYSLLAPWVMAVVGVGLTGFLCAVAAAVLLARLLRTTARPLAGSLAGAVFAVANVVSGRTTFALGAVAALAALVLLPRRGPAAVAAAVSGLFSPVAAAFLGLAAAVLVLRRKPGGWTTGLAASIPVGVIAVLFPSGGVQPYETRSAWYAVLAGLVLAVLTHSSSLRVGALLYALAAAVLVLVADPFGSNILRLGLLLSGPLVIATAIEHMRVVVPVTAALLLWQVQPPLSDLAAQGAPPFRGLNAALVELGSKRVEVVPLRDHEEAAIVAPVVPLARGWSRQEDTVRNPLFYDGNLSAERFQRWLLREGVDHIALAPGARVDGGGRAERALLLVGSVPGLRLVWSDEHWLLWRFTDAAPIARPPAEVLDTDRTTVRLRSTGIGTVPLKVRWSRWLTVSGPACIERHGDGEGTLLRLRGPGEVVVGSVLRLDPPGRC